MARKREGGTSWKKKLAYLVMLLSGAGGIGGWQLKDHPMLQQVLTVLVGDDAPEGKLEALAKTGVAKLIDSASDFSRSGVYEVRIDQLKLDPKAFRTGQTIDLQVRVRSIDESGVEKIAWNSADLGSQKAVVGRDELTATWSNRPFQLGWSPGEMLILEVYSRKLLRETVTFRTNMERSTVFPLRTGPQTLVSVGVEAPVGRPEDSQVTFTSKRIGDRPGQSTAQAQVARGEGQSATR